MRLRSIPTDIAISASFVAVFLLSLFPAVWMFAPDLAVAIKALRDKCRGQPPSVATLGKAD
jgi:hypothetical protein